MQGLDYITVKQLIDESGFTRANVQQAIYELKKKDKIKKPDKSTIQDGKWTLKPGKKKGYNLVCKHLESRDDRFYCKIKNAYIGNKEACTTMQGDYYVPIYRCPGYEDEISNEITVEFSMKKLMLMG
jgi:hypothetical protein